MGVLYDTASELERSTSAATVTWQHTATVANVVGVLIGFVRAGGTLTDNFSNVSYGGVTAARVNRAADTSGEPGSAEWWFAAGVPSGQQTVAYNAGVNAASNVHAVAITVTGAARAYAIGAATNPVSDTASFSVSLTTGYVSGLAFGAFYGGGVGPNQLTYSADRTLVHDWDMGAFYSEVFRLTNATVAGTGPLLGFGGDASSDDVAFAAVFLTDGSIGIGTPQTAAIPQLLGRQPSLLTERLIAPGVGASTGEGRQAALSLTVPPNDHTPTLWTELTQAVGLGALTAAGQVPGLEKTAEEVPTALPAVGLIVLEGRAPALAELERLIEPAAGLATVEGRSPTALGESGIGPSTGLVGLGGLSPALLRELQAGPGVGALSPYGLTPDLLTEAALSPSRGQISLEGRSPDLLREKPVEPGLGLSTLEGRLPVVSQEVWATVEPGEAQVSAEGQTPALLTEALALPGTGYASLEGHAPTALPENAIGPAPAALSLDGLTPELQQETTLPGVAVPPRALLEASALTPSLSTELTLTPAQAELAVAPALAPSEWTSGTAFPSRGAATVVGLDPSANLESTIEPARALLSTEAQPPSVVPEGALAPEVAQAQAAGLSPTLLAEWLAEPAVGAVSIAGLEPMLSGIAEGTVLAQPGVGEAVLDGLAPELVGLEKTIEPAVGTLSTTELSLTLDTGVTLAGRPVKRGKRKGRAGAGTPTFPETSLPPRPVIVTTPPYQPPVAAEFEPPVTAPGGVSVTEIADRITALEQKRARQRREEEELLSFLMKVA